MDRLSQTIFFIFLLSVFLLEGLGLKNGREILYYVILSAPFFLFLIDYLKKKHIFIPAKITALFLFLILFSTISTATSVNIGKSFEFLLLYISLSLIFIYVYQNKDELSKPLIIFIYTLSFIYSFYSLALYYFLPKMNHSLVDNQGYSFLLLPNQNHSHLGDFLMLTLLLSFYFILHKKYFAPALLSILFFLPFFISSLSRSAYLSFGIMLLFFLTKSIKMKKKYMVIFSLIIISVTTLFFFATTEETKKVSFFSPLPKILEKRFDLKGKYFLGRREEYFSWAMASVAERPLMGVGPQNFFNISTKYSQTPYNWTYSSHNIFIDIASEQGLIAVLILLGAIVCLIIRSKKNIFLILFLALIINFQTDYTHRIYSFFLLFFILGGLIYEGNKKSTSNKTLLLLSSILLLLSSLMLISNILAKVKKYQIALLFYPFNNSIYRPVIEEQLTKGNVKKAFSYIELFKRFYSGDASALDYFGETYLLYNRKKEALDLFKQAFIWHPYEGTILFKKIYILENELNGSRQAKKFAVSFFIKIEKIREKNFSSSFIRYEAQELCKEIYKQCPYKL